MKQYLPRFWTQFTLLFHVNRSIQWNCNHQYFCLSTRKSSVESRTSQKVVWGFAIFHCQNLLWYDQQCLVTMRVRRYYLLGGRIPIGYSEFCQIHACLLFDHVQRPKFGPIFEHSDSQYGHCPCFGTTNNSFLYDYGWLLYSSEFHASRNTVGIMVFLCQIRLFQYAN